MRHKEINKRMLSDNIDQPKSFCIIFAYYFNLSLVDIFYAFFIYFRLFPRGKKNQLKMEKLPLFSQPLKRRKKKNIGFLNFFVNISFDYWSKAKM